MLEICGKRKRSTKMAISKIKVGDRVSHKLFGIGTVQLIDGRHATVLFDRKTEGENKRTIVSSFLEPVNVKPKQTTTFQVNDSVFSNEYGPGVVIKSYSNGTSMVSFELSGSEIILPNNSLYVRKASYIEDDEYNEEEINSSFRIIPANYSSQSSYSTTAKRLLTFLRKEHSSEDGLASITSYTTEDGFQVGVLLLPKKGVVVFAMFDTELDYEIITQPLFEAVFVSSKFDTLKSYYIDKFYQSKRFCRFVDNKYKLLNIPVRFVFLFQSIDIDKVQKETNRTIQVLNKDVYFKNFTSLFEDNPLFSSFEPFDKSFDSITNEMYGSILERIIPENATLINIGKEDEPRSIRSDINPEFRPITGEEREFSAIYLDDDQIRMINETKPGHYLTLANPGTGKSVLLVSKAFRIQSKLKDNHVLITCYNKNLAEHHNIFADISGMKTGNLHISTFHKLVIDIMNEIAPDYVREHNPYDYDKEFPIVVNRLEQLIDSNLVAFKFNAIFIDEVQLFEPQWIDICYKLLNKQNNKDFFFEMYGDINQDVRSQKSKGKASWQNTKCIPSLQGRVRYLDKNYRNTDIIANYISTVITEFNNNLENLGLPIDKESACLSSNTTHRGKLRVKIIQSSSRSVWKVSEVVRDLVKNYHADYSEIAVIYPARQYGRYYTPLYHILNEFDNSGFPYNLIHGENTVGRERKYKLYDCNGIIMSTIDSCLGLDFKYVILCGIHFWDFMYSESKKTTINLTKDKIMSDKTTQLYYCEIGKKVYSACSRAREGLFIIDDLDKNSPIKDILRPHKGKGQYYDEY